jgi:hypothetical protein
MISQVASRIQDRRFVNHHLGGQYLGGQFLANYE